MDEKINNKKNARILVIDDEPGIRDLLSYELGNLGYTVVTAKDGEEGVEKVKTDKFQLVISDIKMPKMDGIQTLEAIKTVDPEVEVIMATGFGTIETAVASMKKGAYDFIQKPFNLNEIMNLIDKALEKAELKALVMLYETSKAIFSAVKLEDLLPIFVDLSAKLLKADEVSLMLMGEDKLLYVAAAQGMDPEIKEKIRISLGERVVGKVAKSREPLIINGPLGNDDRFPGMESKDRIKSSILCPLISRNEVLGVLSAARTKSEIPFNPSDLRHVQIFLSQITQAVDNAKLYKSLEEKIEALQKAYAELSQMKDELIQSEKLSAIGELASGVAHELNNPLTTVIGLADLLMEEEDQPEEKRQDYKTIKEQADRCRKIIMNLLQFARKHKFEMQYAQVNEVIERALELLQYDLRSSGIELVKELDGSVPATKIDPNRFQQVFLNLITNARDALVGGESPRLIIKTEYKEGRIRIYIIDNGSGIPDHIIGKIFDPFFTTKPVGKGTGLGLSISFGIVKDHGGNITVQSKKGEGSTFCIELMPTI